MNETTVKGTITNFDWGNPQYVRMSFNVNDNGKIEHWDAGGPSPSRMQGTGWTKDTLKPGDQITAVGHKIKDGTNKLRLDKVVLANGKSLVCYAAPGSANPRTGSSVIYGQARPAWMPGTRPAYRFCAPLLVLDKI